MNKRLWTVWIPNTNFFGLDSNKAEIKINNETFIDAVNRYREYIISKVNDPLLKNSDHHKENYLKFIRSPLSQDISFEKKRYILDNIAFLGRELSTKKESLFDYNTTFRSYYIEDEILYYLCVLAFKDDYLRYDIKDVLVKYSREDYLKKYHKEIKDCILNIWKTTSSCVVENKKISRMLPYEKLYMLLPLSKKEKKEFLNKIFKNNRPLHYLARMGDKKAEKQLIEQFKKSMHYDKYSDELDGKAFLAYKLGIAGSQACAEALVRDLNSPVMDEWGVSNYRSIRVPIIMALGRIHPEVPFLRMDITFIAAKGDRSYCVFGGRDINRVKNYIKKVIEWAENTYNIKPDDKPPEPKLAAVGISIH